ncbi:MAG: hypothetical protein AB1656_12730 [Candidatus Omnitrophota bacterium]
MRKQGQIKSTLPYYPSIPPRSKTGFALPLPPSLPSEQMQKVLEFIDGLDNDLGLDEDAAIADRRYEAMKNNGGKDIVSLDEMRRRLGFS